MKQVFNPINGKQIDKNQTRKRVARFLRSDTGGLARFLMMSGKHKADLKSPKLAAVPNHDSFKNSNEEGMQAIFYAESVVHCAYLALAGLPNTDRKPYRTILIKSYIDRTMNDVTMRRLNYGEAQYYRLKKDACCQFAISFGMHQIKEQLTPVIDLCSYLAVSEAKLAVLA